MYNESRLTIFFGVRFKTKFICLIILLMFNHTFAQESQLLNSSSTNQNSISKQEQKLEFPSSKRKIKVAAAQILTDNDVEKNLLKIVQKIKEAKADNCEIVLFHEGCLTGYPDEKPIHEIDFDKVRKAEKQIIDLAKELKIGVLLGSSSNEDNTFQNYVLIINEKGNVLGKYEKTWRIKKDAHYRPGTGPVIFTIAGVQATVIICHDLRYPELTRLAVAAGAQIVFIANNEAGIFKEYKLLGYRSMQISRATENKVYAVMSNPPAYPHDVLESSHGNSKIVNPNGGIIDEANVFEERLVEGVLDLRKATGETAFRTLGIDPETKETFGVLREVPAYSDWVQEGLKLVKRLDGD